jgi:hypothetical protein
VPGLSLSGSGQWNEVGFRMFFGFLISRSVGFLISPPQFKAQKLDGVPQASPSFLRGYRGTTLNSACTFSSYYRALGLLLIKAISRKISMLVDPGTRPGSLLLKGCRASP